jgi:hypothetical protein
VADATFFLLSGDRAAVTVRLNENFKVREADLRPLDEKEIVHVGALLALVRANPHPTLGFACQDLDLQRFQFVLKGYLLLGRAKRRVLVDESGRYVDVTWPRFLFVDLPRFGWELVASAGEAVIAAVRLEFLLQSVRDGTGGRA